MKKLAVIIKHPGRDWDYRVDVFEVPDETLEQELHDYVMSQMLGPFQILAITERLSLDRKIKSVQGVELVQSVKPTDNPQAFPAVTNTGYKEGMTLLDYFAGEAMNTLLDQKYPDGSPVYPLNHRCYLSTGYDSKPSEKEIAAAHERVKADAALIAQRSYLMSEAMLAERAKHL